MAWPGSSGRSRNSLIEKKVPEKASASNRAFSTHGISPLNEGKKSKHLIRGFIMRILPGAAILFFLMVAALLLCGCDRERQAAAPGPPEVVTMTVQPQEIELTTELPGRTSAYLVSEIRPQVNGIIQKRLFEEGSDVKGDQVLYQIDPAPFQAALDSAKANLAKAEASLIVTRLKLNAIRDY